MEFHIRALTRPNSHNFCHKAVFRGFCIFSQGTSPTPSDIMFMDQNGFRFFPHIILKKNTYLTFLWWIRPVDFSSHFPWNPYCYTVCTAQYTFSLFILLLLHRITISCLCIVTCHSLIAASASVQWDRFVAVHLISLIFAFCAPTLSWKFMYCSSFPYTLLPYESF